LHGGGPGFDSPRLHRVGGVHVDKGRARGTNLVTGVTTEERSCDLWDETSLAGAGGIRRW
jgi:hypothetical protein